MTKSRETTRILYSKLQSEALQISLFQRRAPALSHRMDSEEPRAVGVHFDAELAVVSQILVLPEVAHGALTAQVQLPSLHAQSGGRVVIEIEERQVPIPAVWDAGGPCNFIPFGK